MGFIGGGINLYPDLGDDFVKAVEKKDWAAAEKLQAKIIEANGLMEKLGGGAQGIKKILHDVIGVDIEIVNRNDTFKPESRPGEHEEILAYYRALDLPAYRRK